MELIYFVLVLGVLIFVHELGHFIVARRSGIRVEAFSIGFGPKLFGIKRGDTEYKICAFPIGGFVSMVGEDPEDEHAREPDAFTSKSVGARARVVLAGPLMNALLACVVMPLVFLIGRTEPEFLSRAPIVEQVRNGSAASIAGIVKGDKLVRVDGAKVGSWEDVLDAMLLADAGAVGVVVERKGALVEYSLETSPGASRIGRLGIEPPLFIGNDPVVDQVVGGGPAAVAGVKSGDRVTAVGGEKIADWEGMADAINANGGKPFELQVSRDGGDLALNIVPELNNELGRYVIGVQKDPSRASVPTVFRRFGPIGAIVRGEQEVYRLFRLTVKFLGRLVSSPRTHYKSLGGPVQIAQASVSAAKSGFTHLLYFSAFVSFQLAILNLLPIPVLDGGLVFFLIIEAIRRRPVPGRVRLAAQQVGMVVLLSLLVVVTFNDLDNIFGISRFIGKLF